MANVPPQSVIDARFRAKLDARATGATPVMVDAPAEATPEDLDARVREKLARHRLQAKTVSSAPGAATPEPKAPEPEAKEPTAEQSRDNRGDQHGQRRNR
jgi:hypothetical protein